MPYAIMRFAKRKRGSINSIEAHNERKKEQYKSNPDINTARTAENYHLIQPQYKYYSEIMRRIEESKCRVRKDSVLMIETLVTASPEFISILTENEEREYFERALDFIRDEVGEDNVLAATIHMDERNPHMHVFFVPITPDKRLSAKTIIGNQKKLSEWQTKFHEHRHRPLFSYLDRGQIKLFHQRIIADKGSLGFCSFSELSVEILNSVGCIYNPANLFRIFKHCLNL